MTDQWIDWKGLAEKLGTLREDGETGGDHLARQAVVELLGEESMRNSVRYYVDYLRGFELARSVLWLLRPAVAREECYRIYKEDPDIDRRRAAIELLRVVADRTTLPLVEEFLGDPDPGIQNW